MSSTAPILPKTSSPPPSRTESTSPSAPRRVHLGTLAAAIHRELRESLSPEEVVQLATQLLGKVAEELRDQRIARSSSARD